MLLRISESAAVFVAGTGVVAIVAQGAAQTVQTSGGDVTINIGVLFGLIATIVGSLAATVTFLYRAQSSAHAATIAAMREGQTNQLAAQDRLIISQAETINRQTLRIDGLITDIGTKEKYVLELATGAIEANRDSMDKLNAAVERQTTFMVETSKQAAEEHRNHMSVMTLIASKMGGKIQIGGPNDSGGPDVVIRSG